jgi:ankyrin repeat protein
MNMRLLAGIGSLALSFAASAAPSADLIALAFKAAEAGDLAEVKRLVESAPELVRAVGPHGKPTLLHQAAEGGHAAVAAWLVEHGAPINARDKYRQTPLTFAAYGGFLEIVELLVAHGADVNAENNRLSTPLALAALKGHCDVASLLLERGAHVDGSSTDNHPVNDFVEKGDLDCVRIFIAHGASMKAPDSLWGLPMHHLAGFTDVSKDYRSIAAALLAAGAELDPKNRSGETPLWLAAQRSRPEMVSFLLEKGANPNAKTLTHPSILHSAISSGLKTSQIDDVVERLLEAGADADVWIPGGGWGPAGSAGYTALQQAAKDGYLRIVEQLIDHGADVNRPFADGRTPLWWAATNGHLEVVELLIARGANVNAEAKGRTALKAAQSNQASRFFNAAAEEQPEMQRRRANRDAIVQLLQEHGATK